MAKGIKTGGRTQGTPNKLTAEVKETIKNIVENEINGLETRLNTLETKERIEFLIKLLPYVLPKLQNVETKDTSETQRPIIITRDEQTQKTLESIINDN